MTRFFWLMFYNVLVVPLLWAAFHLYALVDKKAARGLNARKGLLDRLEADFTPTGPPQRRIWFHSSSLGEFEQAKPIIAELKRRHPDIGIVASFFSPSGYEHSHSYKPVEAVTYIPFDSYGGARRFVSLLRPSAAVIVRYDVWPNHVWALRKAGVPTFIANATLRADTLRNLPVIKQFHTALYNCLDYILTVSEDDRDVFRTFHPGHPVMEVIGDTRYDQVWQRSAESKQRQVLSAGIVRNKKIFVIGSSWQEDEEVILPACYRISERHPEFLVILVPHEPTVENLERIEAELNGHISCIRFSILSQYSNQKVILIDSVGILMSLYQYADVAFVGGSFRNGIHNVLEPAAYGVPILCGPNYQNSQEADELMRRGALFPAGSQQEIVAHLRALLEDERKRAHASERALEHVRRNIGATERFLSYLEKVL